MSASSEFIDLTVPSGKTALMPMSSHQSDIVEAMRRGMNVIGDAVAGSGKSTTMVHVAYAFLHCRILILTFSKKLQLEMVKRASKLGIKVDVNTFHGFCSRYGSTCKDTKKMRELLKANPAPSAPFNFDMVLLDESQDMNPTFYELVCKLIRDNGKVPQMGVFGDVNQCIFQYVHADSRFITMATHLYPGTWVKCDLPVSYRISHEIAAFVNKAMLKQDRMIAVKSGPKPTYMIGNAYGLDSLSIIQDMLRRFAPEEIFVLCPSVKPSPNNRHPWHILENNIKLNTSVSVFTPSADDQALDPDVLVGKLVFSTIHQSKGLERKAVLLLGFDKSYFQWFARQSPQDCCPNTWYVGATRATEELAMFHHFQHDYLPFLDQDQLRDTCIVKVNYPINVQPIVMKDHRCRSVSSVVTNVKDYVLEHCMTYLIITSNDVHEPIDIPHTMDTRDGLTEFVSDITGNAIPAMYEINKTGRCSMIDVYKKHHLHNKKGAEIHTGRIHQKTNPHVLTTMCPGKEWTPDVDTVIPSELSVSEVLYWAAVYSAFSSNYLGRIMQIDSYEWLDEAQATVLMNRMSDIEPVCFEAPVTRDFNPHLTIEGRVDCIDVNNTVYEFKCTKELTPVHILQLAVYMWCREASTAETYVLFNLCTNQRITVSCDPDNLERMMGYLMHEQSKEAVVLSDEEFLAVQGKVCQSITEKPYAPAKKKRSVASLAEGKSAKKKKSP